METVYYTFYPREQAKVSGGEDRCAALVRRDAPRKYAPTVNNVISLDDYRERHALRHIPEEDDPAAGETPVRPYPQRGAKVLAALELLACAAIIAVAGVACAVFLL